MQIFSRNSLTYFLAFVSKLKLQTHRRVRKQMEKTPFHHLLHTLDVNNNDKALLTELVHRWDMKSQSFILADVHVPLTPTDVAMILGLPNKGKFVDLYIAPKLTDLHEDLFNGAKLDWTDVE
uniref:Serine/threonine-protein phosphatase 7 long form homolog n=1 Tax=Nelumbo nucifera TaxID=4432 RepID=A0A822ZJ78_NELNU|nr:TPA_asm: hypothetical protein HUJ06_001735 [Nelumbo nucifera]